MNVPEEESFLGIGKYITNGPGFSASFKSEPEDFVVEEISDAPESREDGKYTVIRIKLRNWDTNKFVMRLARELNMHTDRITYAGTKDKYAVTIQNFCVNGNIETFPALKDVEYLDSFKVSRPLRLGNLKGNRFTVTLKDVKENNKNPIKINDEIVEKGGFPNYYGLQRFGTLRPITHIVGKLLVKGDFEAAVTEYLCDPKIDGEDFRINYFNSRDAERSLEEFPSNLLFERTLLRRLAAGDSHERALMALPRNLVMLFVHAYQSYIFNRVLTERFSMVGNLDEVLLGDSVTPVDSYFNSPKNETYLCDNFNLEKLNRLSSENRVRPIIQLPGFGTELSSGPMDTVLRTILESEGIKTEDFRIRNNHAVSSRGNYRIISAKAVNFSMPSKSKMEFELGKGIYATVFLREFLKGQVLS